MLLLAFPGVGQGVCSLQVLECDMRVDLRCCEALVTQQLLYASQPCIIIQHGGGEGVSEHVGRTLLLRCDEGEVVVHDVVYGTYAHRLPFAVAEQWSVAVGAVARLLFTVAKGHVSLELCGDFLTKRDDALLTALARYLQLMAVQVDVAVTEAYHLGPAYTGRVE